MARRRYDAPPATPPDGVPQDSTDSDQLASERLLVAASPNDAVSDTHWLRADVDHHFVRQAIAAGVDYRDRVELTTAMADARGKKIVTSVPRARCSLS